MNINQICTKRPSIWSLVVMAFYFTSRRLRFDFFINLFFSNRIKIVTLNYCHLGHSYK